MFLKHSLVFFVYFISHRLNYLVAEDSVLFRMSHCRIYFMVYSCRAILLEFFSLRSVEGHCESEKLYTRYYSRLNNKYKTGNALWGSTGMCGAQYIACLKNDISLAGPNKQKPFRFYILSYDTRHWACRSPLEFIAHAQMLFVLQNNVRNELCDVSLFARTSAVCQVTLYIEVSNENDGYAYLHSYFISRTLQY